MFVPIALTWILAEGEISLINLIDGDSCSSPESALGKAGLVLWFAIVIWIFIGVSVLCEDYFVTSLEEIAERLHMTEDVAGATLLAGGSSSTQLLAALVGVFFHPDDNPGPGGIVGSVVWNVCIICGGSAIVSGGAQLNWKPVTRDFLFNVLAIVVLYAAQVLVSPGIIEWWESLILVLLYVVYIILIVQLSKKGRLETIAGPMKDPTSDGDEAQKDMYTSPMLDKIENGTGQNGIATAPTIAIGGDFTNKTSFGSSDEAHLSSSAPPPSLTLSKINVASHNHHNSVSVAPGDAQRGERSGTIFSRASAYSRRGREGTHVSDRIATIFTPRSAARSDAAYARAAGGHAPSVTAMAAMPAEVARRESSAALKRQSISPRRSGSEAEVHLLDGDKDIESSTDSSVLDFDAIMKNGNTGRPSRCRQFLNLLGAGFIGLIRLAEKPWYFMYSWTMFDCRKEEYRKYYLVTFSVCLLWLAITSFLMVDLAAKIGDCIGLSPSITGLTLLAIGSSLPDTLGSLIVARQGKCEMALCNAFGSSIFDILLGLGIPWFLAAVAFDKPTPVSTKADALFIAMGVFMAYFIIMLASTRWRMTKYHGYALVVSYAGFIAYIFADSTRVSLFSDVNA